MEKTAVIIDNGQFPKKDYPRYLIRQADYIVCCDGALDRYCRNMKSVFGSERMPDAAIGDLDSISNAMKERYRGPLIHVSEQENNDQTKALEYVLGTFKDVKQIYILGGTGYREDHTIGNLSLLMEYARRYDLSAMGIRIEMVSDYSTAFAMTDTGEIHCGTGRRFSLFSPDNSLKIRSEGLQWQTGGVVFDNWWKATLNRTTEDVVRLEFNHPSIALIIMD